MDDVRLNEKVVVKEIGREGIVGEQAPHAAGGQKDDFRTMRTHPLFDFGLAPQINVRAAWVAQQNARFALKSAHHGTAYHTMLTGNPDTFVGQIKEHRRISPIRLVGSVCTSFKALAHKPPRSAVMQALGAFFMRRVMEKRFRHTATRPSDAGGSFPAVSSGPGASTSWDEYPPLSLAAAST